MGSLIGYVVPDTITTTAGQNPTLSGTNVRGGSGLIQHVLVTSATVNSADWLEFEEGDVGGGQIGPRINLAHFNGGKAAVPMAIPFSNGFTVRGALNAATTVMVIVEWDTPISVF